jgi:hypothetical protein
MIALIPLLGLLAAGGLLYGQGAGDALFIDASGRVGIGTNGPKAQLDVQAAARTSPTNHPASINGMYLTGNLAPDSGVEFRHSNGSQGIGFGYNTIYATGNNANQDLNLKPRGTGRVKVQGVLEGIGALPRGAVLMWSGDPAKLPPGWILCDGAPGTPDLRSRFIVGYNADDSDYKTMRATGGEARHALTPAEIGNHTHAVARGGSAAGTHSHSYVGLPTTDASAGVAVYGPATGGAAQTGAATAHENRPPYMVLAYIMYTGETKK